MITTGLSLSPWAAHKGTTEFTLTGQVGTLTGRIFKLLWFCKTTIGPARSPTVKVTAHRLGPGSNHYSLMSSQYVIRRHKWKCLQFLDNWFRFLIYLFYVIPMPLLGGYWRDSHPLYIFFYIIANFKYQKHHLSVFQINRSGY